MGREEHGRVEEHEVRRGRSRGPKHHHWVPVHVLRADPSGGRGGEGLGGSGVNNGDFSACATAVTLSYFRSYFHEREAILPRSAQIAFF